MRILTIASLALCIAVAPVRAQQTERALRATIQNAEANPSPPALLAAADAARLLREYDLADGYYEDAWNSSLGMINNLISSMLLQELASGGGVDGVQRRFRQVLQVINLPPQTMGVHIGNYPSLLVGGEFDEMILSLSPDATDPLYRCTCYNLKGWVHRVAGRMDESRAYFDSLTTLQQQGTPPADPDAAAQARGQLARDLARAGRTADARRVLEEAMAMPVSDAALPAVHRRWAQAYAELGDVDKAIEYIEPLLDTPSLVTVHTLETRWTWEPIRDDPAFRAMLDRHR